jgi:hypothetical protein
VDRGNVKVRLLLNQNGARKKEIHLETAAGGAAKDVARALVNALR